MVVNLSILKNNGFVKGAFIASVVSAANGNGVCYGMDNESKGFEGPSVSNSDINTTPNFNENVNTGQEKNVLEIVVNSEPTPEGTKYDKKKINTAISDIDSLVNLKLLDVDDLLEKAKIKQNTSPIEGAGNSLSVISEVKGVVEVGDDYIEEIFGKKDPKKKTYTINDYAETLLEEGWGDLGDSQNFFNGNDNNENNDNKDKESGNLLNENSKINEYEHVNEEEYKKKISYLNEKNNAVRFFAKLGEKNLLHEALKKNISEKSKEYEKEYEKEIGEIRNELGSFYKKELHGSFLLAQRFIYLTNLKEDYKLKLLQDCLHNRLGESTFDLSLLGVLFLNNGLTSCFYSLISSWAFNSNPYDKYLGWYADLKSLSCGWKYNFGGFMSLDCGVSALRGLTIGLVELFVDFFVYKKLNLNRKFFAKSLHVTPAYRFISLVSNFINLNLNFYIYENVYITFNFTSLIKSVALAYVECKSLKEEIGKKNLFVNTGISCGSEKREEKIDVELQICSELVGKSEEKFGTIAELYSMTYLNDKEEEYVEDNLKDNADETKNNIDNKMNEYIEDNNNDEVCSCG